MDSLIAEYGREIAAAVSIAVAAVVALLLHRALTGGRRLSGTIAGGDMSPAAQTRLRFLRRIVVAAVLTLGALIALSQFATLSRLATGLLASGALAAAVVGFAARPVLANAVAGLMLAVTQPLRIGDRVTFEEHSGEVEDVGLNYTLLRTGDGTRVVIPNERLASGVLQNHSVLGLTPRPQVELWLPLAADASRAADLLADEEGVESVAVTDASAEAVRLTITGEAVDPAERPDVEARLRVRCLSRLRGAGLVDG